MYFAPQNEIDWIRHVYTMFTTTTTTAWLAQFADSVTENPTELIQHTQL
jgi:hypothetical protein